MKKNNKFISALLILLSVSLLLTISINVIAETNNEKNYPRGDVNGNGKVDAYDYMLVKKAHFGTCELDDQQKIRADIDKNGKMTANDYFLIKRILFGFDIPDYPSEENSKDEISNGGVILPDDEW